MVSVSRKHLSMPSIPEWHREILPDHIQLPVVIAAVTAITKPRVEWAKRQQMGLGCELG